MSAARGILRGLLQTYFKMGILDLIFVCIVGYAIYLMALEYWYYALPGAIAAVTFAVLLYRRRQAQVQAHAQALRPSLGPKEAMEAYQWDLWQARRRRRPNREERRAVYNRDGGRCRRCGDTFDLQYDHIVPFVSGGPTTVENLQLLCRRCNQRKGRNRR